MSVVLDMSTRATPARAFFAASLLFGGCSSKDVGSSDEVGSTMGGDVSDTTQTRTDGGSDSTSDSPESDSPDTTTGEGSGSTTLEGTTSSGPIESDSSSSGEGTGSTGEPSGENLLMNPSLEQWVGAMHPNTWPDDWTHCDVPGTGLEAVPDSCSATPDVAADGQRYARAYAGERLGQTLDTEPGRTYTISVHYVAVEGCYGGAADSSWDVLVDDEVVMTTPAAQGAQTWAIATVDFVATGEATRVCFVKPVGAGGIDMLSVVAR